MTIRLPCECTVSQGTPALNILSYKSEISNISSALCMQVRTTHSEKFTRAFARPTCLRIRSRETACSRAV